MIIYKIAYQGDGGVGLVHLSAPTGGVAYGIPKNFLAPRSINPSMGPYIWAQEKVVKLLPYLVMTCKSWALAYSQHVITVISNNILLTKAIKNKKPPKCSTFNPMKGIYNSKKKFVCNYLFINVFVLSLLLSSMTSRLSIRRNTLISFMLYIVFKSVFHLEIFFFMKYLCAKSLSWIVSLSGSSVFWFFDGGSGFASSCPFWSFLWNYKLFNWWTYFDVRIKVFKRLASNFIFCCK